MKHIKLFENFEESLKQRLINYYGEKEADYGEEEIQNVLEILDEYDDQLSGLGKYDKTLLLRLIDDTDLCDEVNSIYVPDNTTNLFDESNKYNDSKIFDYKILPKEAIKELEMYVNVNNPSNKIEVYPDPQVDGTYALRVTKNEHGHTHPEVFTLLWNKGGYDEIDFDEFPPKSRNLKFFI